MGRFGLQPETELRLEDLDDDGLVERIVSARISGKLHIANKALAILVYRRADDVLARVKLKVPATDAEDVAQEALLSALKASFAGESVGQFVNLLNTIVDRRIADFHRKREKVPDIQPLPEEHESDEGVWGDTPSESDDTGEVAIRMEVEALLGELSEPHRRDVELNVFSGYPARETAENVNEEFGDQLKNPMTEDNVHQIVSRFRSELRNRLSGEDGEA